MYIVERRFQLPIGHRLSKHKGRCKSIHGHNIVVFIKIKRETLNENNMVVDFSDLKRMGMKFLDNWDHALILNETDANSFESKDICERVITIDTDPTAESLCELLYSGLELELKDYDPELKLISVSIWENENSKATYVGR